MAGAAAHRLAALGGDAVRARVHPRALDRARVAHAAVRDPDLGLALVLREDDDGLGWHIATHLAFFGVLALHVGLVLKHQVVDRDRLLTRMT